MNLRKFEGKRVEIKTHENQLFVGMVGDYIYPEDNESGKESIVLDTKDGDLVEFYEKDIKSICYL